MDFPITFALIARAAVAPPFEKGIMWSYSSGCWLPHSTHLPPFASVNVIAYLLAGPPFFEIRRRRFDRLPIFPRRSRDQGYRDYEDEQERGDCGNHSADLIHAGLRFNAERGKALTR